MPRQAQCLISLFRTFVLAGVVLLLITSATIPMPAQNSVPASAVQAARMPQFASRLAHPGARPALRPNPALARPRSGGGAPQDGIIYDNGPINGNTDAWTINFGFVISDSFTVGGGGSVTGMTFGAWLNPGDVLETVDVSITSQPDGGTTYFDQTVSFSASTCVVNGFGFNVCTVASSSFNGPDLQAGTYWVNLKNATVNTGDPVYWDENEGPSQAYDSSVGTIPSEAFSLEGSGDGTPGCFQSQGNLQTIFNFTQQQGGGQDGVVIDHAGALYGANGFGGNNSAGFAFKLSRLGDWLLDPLFNFLGGNSGGQPAGVIIGPNGSLYGGAQGGIQNCGSDGSQYCGLVFNLRPKPTACANALCGWTENVPYRFGSELDGSGAINVSASDQEGNLYGTTSTGGAHGFGTVFELTPSGMGWTKTTLYSFRGNFDGATPTQVLMGNDGNLYGVASGVRIQNGFVFQLMPSGGGQWTERVLHTFQYAEGSNPRYLVQDGAGNLYGITLSGFVGTMFVLQKSSGWAFSEYSTQHSCQPQDFPYDNLNNLAIDAAGNLYGTGSGGMTFAGKSGKTSPGGQECFYNYIFKASYASDGWHYRDLVFLNNTDFFSSGSLALDPSGNLYGTTYTCGTNQSGTVWQLAP